MEIIYTPLKWSDREAFFRLAGDPRVAANMRFDCPRTQIESDQVLEGYLAEGNRPYALRFQPEGALWGVFSFMQETEPEIADLSQMLLPDQWGKGLGHRVLLEMVELARREQWYQILDGYILEHNAASRQMAESIGFREKERHRFPGMTQDLIVYRLEL